MEALAPVLAVSLLRFDRSAPPSRSRNVIGSRMAGARRAADLVDHLAAGMIAWLVPEPGDLRGARPTWATLAHA